MAMSAAELAQAIAAGKLDFDEVRYNIDLATTGVHQGANATVAANDNAIMQSGDVAAIEARLNAIAQNRGINLETTTLHLVEGQVNGGPGVYGQRGGTVGNPAGGGGGGAGGASGTTGASSDFDEGGFAFLQRILDSYGLGELSGWARDQIIAGHSPDWVALELRNQPAFQRRFAAIVQRQQAGLNPISPEDVLTYETQARQLMRAAGMPPGFFDSPDDFVSLLVGDVSISEVADRINEGYIHVANEDPSVRQAFASMFGPDGDGALAAMFLDKDKALPTLLKQVAAAQFGGAGARFGFVIDRDTALKAGGLGMAGQAQQGFSQLAQLRPLFDETISERTDLRAEKEGLDAVFDLGDGSGAAATRTRQKQRTADFGGSSGTSISRTGAAGLGAANNR